MGFRGFPSSSLKTKGEQNKKMKNRLIWRLKEQPTSESLQKLVSAGLLTKEEAREILFSSETNEEPNADSLKSEIKFLRELVEKLSNSRKEIIIEKIKEIEVPYYRRNWYHPYKFYCNSDSTSTVNLTSSCDASAQTSTFSSIKTF